MSGLVRSLSRDLAVNLGRLLDNRIPTVELDSDAISYFDAVEAAGGSFDLTAIDPTYTISYVKEKHSDFYTGLKSDGLWDKLTEFYFLAGKTFDGLTVKGKGTGTLTNNNFVSGDWLAAGTGAGLAGDRSSKYLTGTIEDVNIGNGADDRHFGSYLQNLGTTNFSYITGANSNTEQWGILVNPINSSYRLMIPFDDADDNYAGILNGHAIGSRRSVNDVERYHDGVSVFNDTSTASAETVPYNWPIFAFNENGTIKYFSNAKISMIHFGTGLTDTDAANLSTRVNTLMTALGCNVY